MGGVSVKVKCGPEGTVFSGEVRGIQTHNSCVPVSWGAAFCTSKILWFMFFLGLLIRWSIQISKVDGYVLEICDISIVWKCLTYMYI